LGDFDVDSESNTMDDCSRGVLMELVFMSNNPNCNRPMGGFRVEWRADFLYSTKALTQQQLIDIDANSGSTVQLAITTIVAVDGNEDVIASMYNIL
jgi:hypothetical protein